MGSFATLRLLSAGLLLAGALAGCNFSSAREATCRDIDQAVKNFDEPELVTVWMDRALEDARSDLDEEDALRRDLEFLAGEGGGSFLSLVTMRANHCE